MEAVQAHARQRQCALATKREREERVASLRKRCANAQVPQQVSQRRQERKQSLFAADDLDVGPPRPAADDADVGPPRPAADDVESVRPEGSTAAPAHKKPFFANRSHLCEASEAVSVSDVPQVCSSCVDLVQM